MTERKKRIGELLVEAGAITDAQLRDGLQAQEEHGGRLCYNLIRLGFLTADVLLGFLREQFGVAAVNLEKYVIAPDVIAVIPAGLAREMKVVPLHLIEQTLTVAMIDPARSEDVSRIQEATGCAVEPVISPESSIRSALDRYYPAGEAQESGGEGLLLLEEEGEEKGNEESPEEWLRRIVMQAIKRRSREIHLEPAATGLRVRYRVGEELEEGESVPSGAGFGVVRAALDAAKMDRRRSESRPLEGRLRIGVKSRRLRATLSSFPTLFGGRLVIKLMEEELLHRDFQELGMSKEVADELGKILRLREGVVLVTAPPNHGKKTTFYSMLDYLATLGGRNVMTLEHPVQYPLDGIGQTQVSFGGGMDFYYGLQSLLRQEPDVIGITDINDGKTLELVFTAARQCLVIGLCSLRDSRQLLEWIAGTGISHGTQALRLRSVLSQRLVPRLCSRCRGPLEEPVTLVEGVRDKRDEELVFYQGAGCEHCGGTGRTGRLGIYELVSLRGHLRDLLLQEMEAQIIYDEAQRQGMWTMQEDGIRKATQGLVDIRDVLDATRGDREEE